MRKYLFSRGTSVQEECEIASGESDLVFPKYRAVVFINGCFWHQHQDCKYGVMPKTNRDYWESKLKRNVQKRC